MKDSNPIHALILIVALIAGIFGVAILTGCQPPLTPQTKAAISIVQQDAAIATAKSKQAAVVAAAKVQDETAVALAKAAAAAKLKLAQDAADAKLKKIHGATNPAAHPIAATNNLMVELRPWFKWISIFSGLACAVSIGLKYTPLRFLGALEPVFRWVAILNFAAWVALPWLPAGLVLAGLAIAGILIEFIYYLVKCKGNVHEAFEDTETQIYGHADSTARSLSSTLPLIPVEKHLITEIGTLRMPIEVSSSAPTSTSSGQAAASPHATSPAEPPTAA